MDSSHLDHQADRSLLEMSSDSSVSSDSSDPSDMFEDPLIHPRVGDEYQVEMPPMLTKSVLLQLTISPANSEGISDSSHSYLTGLPVPLMWVDNHGSSVKNESLESENTAAVQNSLHQKEPIIRVNDPKQTSLNNEYFVAPGLPTEAWSDFEADCFLLGLYIFGKDLLQVKRFMDSKDIGQILTYYYGQFRGSAGQLKWSECRKMRNKKCIVGDRFLTGYRQQELFSRLLPHLSEESKTKLLEASRAFAEGSTSLDEYVSTLKALVGIRALLEAVAIGKGKQDLTTFVVDSKNTQMFTHRLDIPSAKACSSLTCAEIVKYLKGEIRLSKARSNDLFWEAVWPRLLARGWHSEEPRVDVYAGSKNGLVFLVPGVKKFSRRKLTKGDHYFDSVTDVLAKVANEPKLLELEGDETKPENSTEGNGWAAEMNSGVDQELSDREHHCYLRPRVSAGLSNLTKFTVVDTSLASEGNPLKTRELRSLPADAKRCFNASSRLKKIETELEGSANIVSNGLKSIDKSQAIKHQFSRRIKIGQSSCSVPFTKRRKLASCVVADVTFVLSLPAQGENATTSKKVVPARTSQQQVKVKELSTGSSMADMSDLKILEDKMNEKIADSSPENGAVPELQKTIDLNELQAPTQTEGDAKVISKEAENTANHYCDAVKPNHFEADIGYGPSDTKGVLLTSTVVGPANKDGGSDQQPRRQSTRNRPLTTKALEALEIGFLHPIRHSRKRCPSTPEDQKQRKRTYQRRGKSFMFPDVIGFQDRACNAKTDALGKPPLGTMTIPTEVSGL